MLNTQRETEGDQERVLQDPPIAAFLFKSSTPVVVWAWLIIRVWLGTQWIMLGWQTLAEPVRPDVLAASVAAAHMVLGTVLVVGAFVGIAATGGVIANVLAYAIPGGSDGDPFGVIAAALLILAWKNAGYVGADRYLLRLFGAPWWDTQVPHIPRSAPVRAAAPNRKTAR